jgi:hypothetical protein
MATRFAYRQPQAGSQGFARTRKVIGGAANVAGGAGVTGTGDLALNANVALFRVPKDFVVTGWFGPAFPKLDSGATLTFNLGDVGNPTRYLAASTLGQAGGALPAFPAGALYYQYPTDTDMIMNISAAAAGNQAAPGPVTIYLEGFIAP